MSEPDDEKLVAASAQKLYGAGQKIWDPSDRWNRVKTRRIDEFGRRFASEHLDAAGVVLDAGCGCEGYAWLPEHRIRLDRFEAQVRGQPHAVVASLDALPFRNGAIDFTICVGAVLNYVSAAEALSEIARVTRPGGKLLLHFETSSSFEHIFTGRWRASVTRIETLNSGRPDTIWVYRPTYIYRLLTAFGFRIVHRRGFHIGSALGLRLGMNQHQAANFAFFDRTLSWLRSVADDIILLAEKAGEGVGGKAE